MTRDGEIPTIFGRRARTPSVVVTDGNNPIVETSTQGPNQVPGASNPASTTGSVPNGPYSGPGITQSQSIDQTITSNDNENSQNQNSGTPSKLRACGSGLCSEPARKVKIQHSNPFF